VLGAARVILFGKTTTPDFAKYFAMMLTTAVMFFVPGVYGIASLRKV